MSMAQLLKQQAAASHEGGFRAGLRRAAEMARAKGQRGLAADYADMADSPRCLVSACPRCSHPAHVLDCASVKSSPCPCVPAEER